MLTVSAKTNLVLGVARDFNIHHNFPVWQWDKVENKTSVAVYAAGAVVALWLSSTIVGAVNAVPLVSDMGPTEMFIINWLNRTMNMTRLTLQHHVVWVQFSQACIHVIHTPIILVHS